jgi:hypothetical protein
MGPAVAAVGGGGGGGGVKAQLEVGWSAAIAAGARSVEGSQATVNVVKE